MCPAILADFGTHSRKTGHTDLFSEISTYFSTTSVQTAELSACSISHFLDKPTNEPKTIKTPRKVWLHCEIWTKPECVGHTENCVCPVCPNSL